MGGGKFYAARVEPLPVSELRQIVTDLRNATHAPAETTPAQPTPTVPDDDRPVNENTEPVAPAGTSGRPV